MLSSRFCAGSLSNYAPTASITHPVQTLLLNYRFSGRSVLMTAEFKGQEGKGSVSAVWCLTTTPFLSHSMTDKPQQSR